MITYRIYFRSSSRIVGREDFTADDDRTAVVIAEILYDACSDKCDSFGLWRGTHCVVGRGVLPRPLGAEIVQGNNQASVIECLEAIQRSHWSIASSERLLMRLNELRAQSR
jgi:hypothetical protein